MDAIRYIAERRIAEAEEDGVFDNLPGTGKPLQLEDDSLIPEDLRMAYKVLKNAGYLPEEVQQRKDVQTLVELLDACTDEQEKVRQMKKLTVLVHRLKQSGRLSATALEDESYYEKLVQSMTVPLRK